MGCCRTLKEGEYTFDASTKTVTLLNMEVPHQFIRQVANLHPDRNRFIYSGIGGLFGATHSFSGGNTVFVLEADTTADSDSDTLRIDIYDPLWDLKREIASRSHEIFGIAVSTSKINQMKARWDKPLATNDVSYSGQLGTSNSQPSGDSTLHLNSGILSTGTSYAVTGRKVLYDNGFANFGGFTFACETLPTNANNYGWIGIYDPITGDGFRIAIRSSGLAVQHVRNTTIQSEVLQADFDDPLDGSVFSNWTNKFNQGEALDITTLNVFEIDYGWYSASPIRFKILNKDGSGWYVFHTINYPNTATRSHIRTPNLPVSMGITKVSGSLTDIEIYSGSWAGGGYNDPSTIREYDKQGRIRFHNSIAVTGLITPVSGVVHSVTTSRMGFIETLFYTCSNTITAGGLITYTDNGVIVMRDQIQGVTNQTKPSVRQGRTYRNSPFQIGSDLTLNIPAIGIGASATCDITLYEEIIK